MASEAKGSEFLLQVEDPLNAGTFDTMGGLKTKSGTLNGEAVDVTNHGSNGWREMLNGAGINSIDVSGEGVTQRVEVFKRVLEYWKNKAFLTWRLSMAFGAENVIQITGLFQTTSIEFSGENDKEVPYSLSLQNSGEPDIQIF